MLKIRLQRTGKRNAPTYRLVVAEHSAPIQGKFVEIVGNYIPTKHNRTLEIKKERIAYWISVGAQPSQTIARLCVSEGMKDLEKFIETRLMKPSKVEMRAQEAKQKAEEEKIKAEEEKAKAKAEAEKAQEASVAEAPAEAPAETQTEAPAETEVKPEEVTA